MAAAPPTSKPVFMSNEQKVDYLKHLRRTVSRPSGSRPPPVSKYAHALRRVDTDITEIDSPRPSIQQSSSLPVMPSQQTFHRASKASVTDTKASGRPFVRAPSALSQEQDSGHTLRRIPSVTYLENGTRWMEKQEVKSLRQALNDMDLAEEQRVHEAAQDEAAELVWKHQNPTAPYKNPDVQKDYKSHLEKGSYQRGNTDSVPMIASRSSSGSSMDGKARKVSPVDDAGRTPNTSSIPGADKTRKASESASNESRRISSGKSYGELADLVRKDIADSRRRTSSGSRRLMSGEKKYFMHPDDKIWEDVEESSKKPFSSIPDLRPTQPVSVPAYVRKNPFARVRMQQERLERSNSAPLLGQPVKQERVEIQRNPPSQSRNAEYTSSQECLPQGSREEEREMRGDDIRAATSRLRRERSPNLPQPTLVSDKPGRPIVSFRSDPPDEIVLEEVKASSDRSVPANSRPSSSATVVVKPPQSSTPAAPTIHLPDAGPTIPTIHLPDEVPTIPTIVLPEEPSFTDGSDIPTILFDVPSISVDVPTINVNDTPTARRPLPSTTRRTKSTPHYSPSMRQSNVLCAHCALPIAGRILSAAGERFHPGCFVCQECNCNLELVAFYPEPEAKRADRVERIRARQVGELLDDGDADGDEILRFYCHLDFHETFSPRCKSCKTPIEGEIVVACGAEWHAGHFFCAQCGDPFDSKTPFVEKDGYAWCVGCHTNRYSSKCRKCKKPVIDVVVKALGADWHSNCFRCRECNGDFDDGKYFLRGESQDPVCVRCEEIRLKA